MSSFTSLASVSEVKLGFKSLQNDFFYVNALTIDSYDIESEFLKPILRLKDLDTSKYVQDVENYYWAFTCQSSEADLRGTGAARYISAMAHKPASSKKQGSKTQSISEALKAQSGSSWYSPKANPRGSRIWLRKAFDGTFSPFVFDRPVVVDQRCNSITPLIAEHGQLLAAAMTSSLFSYAIEVNGGIGMGAGALEAPTRKLRAYPILDIRSLKSDFAAHLIALAEDVWSQTIPVDWTSKTQRVPESVKELDSYCLWLASSSMSLDRLYADFERLVRSRLAVAMDKDLLHGKRAADNIGKVAQNIANDANKLLSRKRFPEDFIGPDATSEHLYVQRSGPISILSEPLMDQTEVSIYSADGTLLVQRSLQRSIAESLVRALLMGRQDFSIPQTKDSAELAIQSFATFFAQVEKQIGAAVSASALGTGFYDSLRIEVYRTLRIHTMAGAKELPRRLDLPAVEAES